MPVTADGGSVPKVKGHDARRNAGDVPDQVGGDHQAVSGLPELRGLPAGLRAHGADHVGPDRVPAVRHGRRHSERQTGERARDAQHSRRTLRDLQGRVRRASFDGPAARRRARGLREIPATAGCHRIRRAARRRIRQESRLQETSALLRAHGLQGHLRRPRHALHGRWRREIRRRLRAARFHADQPHTRRRRHHLRADAQLRVQRRQRRSGRRAQGVASDTRPGRFARNLGRHVVQSLRHHARDVGLERRHRGRRGGQSRRLLDLRDHGRILPRPGQLPESRQRGAHQGHHLLRRQHRRESLSRPARRLLPHAQGRDDGARVISRSQDRLLRFARSLHRAAARRSRPRLPI